MNSIFSEQILADKLSKLNSTQQCIETLSHWCIFHRKNAEVVVQTWEKQFHSSQKEQKVSFLYLANDILQNSKRNGTEFVGEFWKVLPAALKDVHDNGDEHGKKVVSRLVGIWKERKVFGSRAQDLKELMLGSEQPPALELTNNRKRSRSVKIVKRDSRSVRVKLSIGGTVEKVVSAFHNVLSDHSNEEEDLSKCKAAVRYLEKMEKDVDLACARVGDPRRATLVEQLEEEEKGLKQCIEKLKSAEATRSILVTQLREALHEQESELESVRTQLQLAQAQVDQAANMKRRLNNEPIIVPPTPPSTTAMPAPSDSNGSSAIELSSKKTAAAIAKEVADKLAASTHSQQIMTSVLTSFAAEEAKNAGVSSTTTRESIGLTEAHSDRSKPEKPVSVAVTTAFVPIQQPQQTVLVQQASTVQNQPSTPQQYNLYAAPPNQQYLQPAGGVLVGMPYPYGPMPPPPPAQTQQMANLTRPAPAPMALVQQQLPPPIPMAMPQQIPQLNQPPIPLALQQPAPPSFRPLQPPGMAFYHPQPQ